MNCYRRIVTAFTYALVIMLFLAVPCYCLAAPSLEKIKAEFKNMRTGKRGWPRWNN